ncbi:MAG: SIS domain-containing protein [Defluviitaleaceae bacterium]|nr:SIS domain-containing protein [Defluviitaleaceae bacterium]
MKRSSAAHIKRLIERHPALAACEAEINAACETLINCYKNNGKLLICGNGGSAADCGHIVGELMKGFLLKRELGRREADAIKKRHPAEAKHLIDNLQGALPAINLTECAALLTAYSNDVASEFAFAQQVLGLGAKGDVLLAISTSGNSKNVINASFVAQAFGLSVIGLTGEPGGALPARCDVAVRVPASNTPDIQELHLPVYHAICAAVEEEFFGG